MIKYTMSLFLALLLTSCASTNSYKAPDAKQYGDQIATIKGFHKKYSLFDWREAYVTSIDDKEISYFTEDMIGGYKGNKVTPVLAGQHSFAVNGSFNRKFMGSGPYETYLDLSANLQPGNKYHLEMDVHGATISVWLVDQSGKTVSAVASNTYKTIPRTNTIYVPVSNK